MSPALSDRIAILDTLTLLSGSHVPDSGQMCVMEAVAYVAGERWSDHPACACPVISAFLRSWNDSLPTNADRDRLLKPLVLQLIDTKSTKEVEEKRSYLALDWFKKRPRCGPRCVPSCGPRCVPEWLQASALDLVARMIAVTPAIKEV